MGFFDLFKSQAEKEWLSHIESSFCNIKPYVDDIIYTFENGDIPTLQKKLFNLYEYFNKPNGGKLITSFPEKDRLCECFNMMLMYDWMFDSDIREVWAEDGFYCIAKYINKKNLMAQDLVAASLDLFILCANGKKSLEPKFNDILNKARINPSHHNIFDEEDYVGGASYLIREFMFFSATFISAIEKVHPEVISPDLRYLYESAKMDYEFVNVSPIRIQAKMDFIATIIGNILDMM